MIRLSSLRLAGGLVLAAALLVGCGGSQPTDSGAMTFDPNLFPADQLVPAATIYEAVQNGSDILFVDSRAQSEYEAGHIPGAINVPYFEADQHLDEVPKDQWVVTYCECPHAEAMQVADVLTQNGYEYVRVIDEGLQGWRDQGGQTITGTEPGA